MKRKKQKQTQWGLVTLLGILILISTVGHLEMGGDILPNVFKGILGTVIGAWGVIKSDEWGVFEEE